MIFVVLNTLGGWILPNMQDAPCYLVNLEVGVCCIVLEAVIKIWSGFLQLVIILNSDRIK